MNKTKNFVKDILLEKYELKLSLNKYFSLRSYAKYLGINHVSLSYVLKGERPFPLNDVEKVCKKLALSPLEEQKFKECVLLSRKKSSHNKIKLNSADNLLKEEVHYRVISEWEYFAMISLLSLKNIVHEQKWFAKKLMVSESRVKIVLDNLMTLGLIKYEDNKFKSVHTDFKTTEDIQSKALLNGHLQDLNIAREKLLTTSVNKRDISSYTFSMNKKNINKAKSLIRQFREDFASLVEEEPGDSIYKLNIQLLPLIES